MTKSPQDRPLTFKELREKNVPRCVRAFHPLGEWSATDYACAMAGECGEVCNEIKKLKRGDFERVSELVTREKIGDELADMIIYADLLAARLDIDLGEAVVRKFNEVSKKRDVPIFL